ncbi:TPA: hypothetical protein ENS27_07200 [bacterium]|nr:hypothetical protein [bacterium]
MKKKGYFFILDAFIAATIITVSLVTIMNSDVAVEQRTKEYSQVEGITLFLMDTKLEDLNNQYVKSLIANGNITDPRNSVMEQIDWFYYKAKYVCKTLDCSQINYNLSRDLLKNISEPVISQKYGFNYLIIDTSVNSIIYNYSVYNRSLETRSASSFIVINKRISYVKYNQTAVFFPHIVEFSIWTK